MPFSSVCSNHALLLLFRFLTGSLTRKERKLTFITMNNSTQINSSDDTRCSEAVSVLFTTAMAVITFGGLIGNLLVFVTVKRNRNLRTSTNYYYVNMAVSDFIASLTAWPLYLTDEIITSKGSLIDSPLATPGCKVAVYVRLVSSIVSILSLVLIAVERFIATVYPLKARLLSSKIRIILMFAVWFIAFGYLVPMFYFHKVEDVGEETFCRFTWDDTLALAIYHIVALIMLTIAPLITIVILYSRIMCALRQRPNTECSAGSSIAEQKRRKQSQNIMRIFKSIVIAYCICLVPFMVYLILKMTFSELFTKDKCKWILGFSYFVLPSLSTAINPVILFSFSSNFRLTLQAFCSSLCRLEKLRSCCKWKHRSVLSLNNSVELPVLSRHRENSWKEKDSAKNEDLSKTYP